jgi:hypothetical protein
MCVLSTAVVECFFAQYKQFVMRLPRAPSVSLLQSKAFISGFVRACRTKREHDTPPKRRASPIRRPEWVIKQGECGRKTARHIFFSERLAGRDGHANKSAHFADASGAWRGASPETRRRCKRKAKVENSITTTLKLDSLQRLNEPKTELASAWGIGAGSEYPLPEKAIEELFEQRSGVKLGAASWKSDFGSRVLEDPEFPAVVEYERPLKVCVYVVHSEHLAMFIVDATDILYGLIIVH